MAKATKDLRPDVERPAKAECSSARWFRGALELAALLSILATVLFAGLILAGSHGKRSSPPAFLTKALGSHDDSASLGKKPAAGVTVRVGRSGYMVDRHQGAKAPEGRNDPKGLVPSVRPDGWLQFAAPGAGLDLRLLQIAILTLAGSNLKPLGLWKLRTRGSSQQLLLGLGDQRPLLPYLIGPSLTGASSGSAFVAVLLGPPQDRGPPVGGR
jgi:hypothetical protein